MRASQLWRYLERSFKSRQTLQGSLSGVDGVDLERVTPSTIDVSGEIDQTVQLQLRQGQSVLAETMLILGPDIEREWRPEIIAPSGSLSRDERTCEGSSLCQLTGDATAYTGGSGVRKLRCRYSFESSWKVTSQAEAYSRKRS